MSERKPMVLVFAGPNGSGKTTIKELFQIVGEYWTEKQLFNLIGIHS